MTKTFEIIISGQVQGVGFRPFVFNQAQIHGIKGCVFNNERGVVIHLHAQKKETVKNFASVLKKNAPKVAVITSLTIHEKQHTKFSGFEILPSDKKSRIDLPLTPDFALCSNCRTEIDTPKNRRYRYAFTTCTCCGPRYSITSEFPFERRHTSMLKFAMCTSCNDEYSNPEDRRFHSQTNSCPICGITLELVDSKGKVLLKDQRGILAKAASLIKAGKILAIKNTSGYLLCCDARNPKSIKTLRARKLRPNKPFALLYPSMALLEKQFLITKEEEAELTSIAGPIVLLSHLKRPILLDQESIAPNLNRLGVMLPNSALLQLIMNELGSPVVATSGNIHGSPILSSKAEVEENLKEVADYSIHHDLDVQYPQDDSVIKFSNTERIVMRRSRGMAPNYLTFKMKVNAPILAMGSDLKSTFTFVPKRHAYVSPYFGNLNSYPVYSRFMHTITQYIDLFETSPKVVLADKHPQYQSRQLGKNISEEHHCPFIEIQHHKAHFASVLADHRLFKTSEKILGVIWDGTGWGEDEAVWGGEFFTYLNGKMERLTHFAYFDWLANDKMAREPRLSLFSLTAKKNRERIRHKFTATEWKVYIKLSENNTLKTSSVGRLFDAVASLLDLTDLNTYEAEAAMLLENEAIKYQGKAYINFLENEDYNKVPSKKIIEKVFDEVSKGTSKSKIADSFIHSMAHIILHVATVHEFKIIACSGGVFQNGVLLNHLIDLAESTGILLKINRILSSNDENISFGQLSYYLNVKH